MGPIAWLAFAATGLAQLTAMISSVQSMSKFASGGIVGGSSTHGDRKFARVNSGEMILNKSQQTQLFNLINGRFTPPSVMDRRMQPVVVQPLAMDMAGGASPVVNITMNADARRMLQVLSDANKVAGVSGKRYF